MNLIALCVEQSAISFFSFLNKIVTHVDQPCGIADVLLNQSGETPECFEFLEKNSGGFKKKRIVNFNRHSTEFIKHAK